MTHASQKGMARYGTPVRTRVKVDVGRALIAEATRINRSVGHTAAMILEYWYEDVYLPSQKGECGQAIKKPPV
jgi:hypothetical protein